MTITNINDKVWDIRSQKIEARTLVFMNYLLEIGHFTSLTKATLTEDKLGVDFRVVIAGSDEEIPVQCKIRANGRKDIGIVRYQPFWGTGYETTVIGRDFLGLLNKVSVKYYVATTINDYFDDIYSVPCSKLLPSVLELEQQWQNSEKIPPQFLDNPRVIQWLNAGKYNYQIFSNDTGGQVYFKKNDDERYPKINMYLPQNLKEWSITLKKPDSIRLKDLYIED